MIEFFVMATELTEQQIAQIRHAFKRCREDTVEAIIKLRRTADPSLIPAIVRGIVWRYVRPELRELVDQAAPETPLSAVGLDSLMMLEVVLDIQDALDVVIEDAELRKMQTIGDFVGLLTERFTATHNKAV